MLTKKNSGFSPVMSIPLRHADPANITAAERTFFVTSSIAAKRNLLQSERSARLFIDVLYYYRAQQKYMLHAFVAMPDHFHVLITVKSISIERPSNSSKADSLSAPAKNSDFALPCGSEVSPK
jgi:putative transposase